MVGADQKNKQRVSAPAVTADTTGLYTFDELMDGHIIDRSGNGHHGLVLNSVSGETVPLPSGPDRLGGSGGSAKFDGKTFAAFPRAFTEGLHGMTLSSWFFLSDHKVTTISPKHGCSLFGSGPITLSILSTSHLLVHIGDRAFMSHAKIRPLVWAHIALVHDPENRAFTLYVNGVKDIYARNLPATPLPSFSSVSKLAPLDAASILYVGGLPSQHPHYAECSGEFLLDDVRASSIARPVHEIAAESFPALGAVEASFTTLGCSRHNPCNHQQAQRSCPVGYHLCSRSELLAGALGVGRALGWLEWNDQVWAASEDNKPASMPVSAYADATAFLELSTELQSNPYEALEALEFADDADHYAMLEQELHAADAPAAPAPPAAKPAAAAEPAPAATETVTEVAEYDYVTTTPPDATFARIPVPSSRVTGKNAGMEWMSKLALCCKYN